MILFFGHTKQTMFTLKTNVLVVRDSASVSFFQCGLFLVFSVDLKFKDTKIQNWLS